jgi:hypothetical protein
MTIIGHPGFQFIPHSLPHSACRKDTMKKNENETRILKSLPKTAIKFTPYAVAREKLEDDPKTLARYFVGKVTIDGKMHRIAMRFM